MKNILFLLILVYVWSEYYNYTKGGTEKKQLLGEKYQPVNYEKPVDTIYLAKGIDYYTKIENSLQKVSLYKRMHIVDSCSLYMDSANYWLDQLHKH